MHISSGDAQGSAAPAPAPVAPPLRLQLDAEAGSSDDEFRPGELFAKYRRDELHRTSTGDLLTLTYCEIVTIIK